jgi:hypothetical protein
LRIRQEDAGLHEPCADEEAFSGSDRALLNGAVTLSAARRMQSDGMEVTSAAGVLERIPPTAARVLIGGKVAGASGFLPGVFEEALLALERGQPLYVLGGFGGAAAHLAEQLLQPDQLSSTFDADWLEAQTPDLERLNRLFLAQRLGPGVRSTRELLRALHGAIGRVRQTSLSNVLQTGLDEAQTRKLLLTQSVDDAVRMVLEGLQQRQLRPLE